MSERRLPKPSQIKALHRALANTQRERQELVINVTLLRRDLDVAARGMCEAIAHLERAEAPPAVVALLQRHLPELAHQHAKGVSGLAHCLACVVDHCRTADESPRAGSTSSSLQ